MIHDFSGRLRVEWKGPSTGKLMSKWENVVVRVGARNGQEGRKPGGNETWLEANGTGQEAEDEEGVKEREWRSERGVFPRPLYVLGVWEGPA